MVPFTKLILLALQRAARCIANHGKGKRNRSNTNQDDDFLPANTVRLGRGVLRSLVVDGGVRCCHRRGWRGRSFFLVASSSCPKARQRHSRESGLWAPS